MFIWTSYVDVLRALLFVFAHLFGGSTGGAIIAVSCLVRLALMPLALRMARRGLEMQRKLKEMEPRLATLRRRHADDPARLYAETRKLHRQHGIRLMSGGTVLNLAVQIPAATGLYQGYWQRRRAGPRPAWRRLPAAL